MTLVDTNVLVYAVNSASPFHRQSRGWLDGALSGRAPVGFAWMALVGFVRLVTHPAIVSRPLSTTTACDIVDAWLGARSAHVLQPGRDHARLFRAMLADGPGGNRTNDAHLAALAMEHQATVVSYDSDFELFPSVRWERPR